MKTHESPQQKLVMEVYASNLSLTEELKQVDSWSSVDIYPSTTVEFQLQWATLPQNIKEESHVRQKRHKITPSCICIQLHSLINTSHTTILYTHKSKNCGWQEKKSIHFKTASELTIILGEIFNFSQCSPYKEIFPILLNFWDKCEIVSTLISHVGYWAKFHEPQSLYWVELNWTFRLKSNQS